MGFGSELRRGLFEKIQDFSFSNIDKFSTASLVTRITTDVNNAQNAFMMTIRILVRAPLMLVSATIMAFTINASLVTVFLVAVPILAVALLLIGAAAFPPFNAMLKKYDKMNGSVQENLIAIRVVKAFVRSVYEKAKFKAANYEPDASLHQGREDRICNVPFMQLTMYACIISILWFGGNMIIGGSMMTGELISFISYVTQILMALMMISMVFINIVLSRASIGRITEVLDEPIDITDHDAAEGTEVENGSIDFQHVFFKYNRESDNDILEDVNLHIEPGETVGIIGGTGSAKTTLVQLIPRLYDVTSGQVLVSGHDVRDYRLETLRNSVSMVLQMILFLTIKENLKWGNADATDDEIVAACEAAQAHGFISSFPKGYDTDLGRVEGNGLRGAETAVVHSQGSSEEAEDNNTGRQHQRRGHGNRCQRSDRRFGDNLRGATTPHNSPEDNVCVRFRQDNSAQRGQSGRGGNAREALWRLTKSIVRSTVLSRRGWPDHGEADLAFRSPKAPRRRF